MVSSKELDKRFEERVAPSIKVKSSKDSPYSTKPKTDVYKIGKAYGGYRVEKQIKGTSGESNISARYTAKEMDIYLRGMEAGGKIRSGKSDQVFY